MCNSNVNFNRLSVFFICLMSLPSQLVSSLLMTKLHNEFSNEATTIPNDYFDSHLHQQIVLLDYFVNKFRQVSDYRSRELLHIKTSPYKTSYFDQQVVEETVAAKTDYLPYAVYHNEVDSHNFGKKPSYNEGKKKKKKSWRSLSRNKKASIILGSIGFAFVKLRLISFPSLGVSEDANTTSTTSTKTPIITTATTPTTSTTSTTTFINNMDTATIPAITQDTTTTTSPLSTTMTTTTTTAMMPNFFSRLLGVSCVTQVTDTMGEYKTIRTPGTQVEQCLSITVAEGSKIQINCDSINVFSGTYVMILDLAGTNVVANPPIINTPYTTADNTLIIKSLTSSANADQLCCSWITV